MRLFLRFFVFTLISVMVTQFLLNGFEFGSNHNRNYILVVLGITLLYFFLKPILGLVSLPRRGIGFMVINFFMTAVIVYVLTVFVPGFNIKEGFFPELIIFGFMLPSKQLTLAWSLIYSALFVSLVFTFFDWLGSDR